MRVILNNVITLVGILFAFQFSEPPCWAVTEAEKRDDQFYEYYVVNGIVNSHEKSEVQKNLAIYREGLLEEIRKNLGRDWNKQYVNFIKDVDRFHAAMERDELHAPEESATHSHSGSIAVSGVSKRELKRIKERAFANSAKDREYEECIREVQKESVGDGVDFRMTQKILDSNSRIQGGFERCRGIRQPIYDQLLSIYLAKASEEKLQNAQGSATKKGSRHKVSLPPRSESSLRFEEDESHFSFGATDSFDSCSTTVQDRFSEFGVKPEHMKALWNFTLILRAAGLVNESKFQELARSHRVSASKIVSDARTFAQSTRVSSEPAAISQARQERQQEPRINPRLIESARGPLYGTEEMNTFKVNRSREEFSERYPNAYRFNRDVFDTESITVAIESYFKKKERVGFYNPYSGEIEKRTSARWSNPSPNFIVSHPLFVPLSNRDRQVDFDNVHRPISWKKLYESVTSTVKVINQQISDYPATIAIPLLMVKMDPGDPIQHATTLIVRITGPEEDPNSKVQILGINPFYPEDPTSIYNEVLRSSILAVSNAFSRNRRIEAEQLGRHIEVEIPTTTCTLHTYQAMKRAYENSQNGRGLFEVPDTLGPLDNVGGINSLLSEIRGNIISSSH